MTTLRPSPLRARLRGSGRILAKEIAAFGVIGTMAFVIDIGLFTWLTHSVALGALKSKAVSTVVSTTFAYFGNRHLSFAHRARTSIGRETSYFFGINFLTLIFSEAVLALFIYAFGFGHQSSVVFAVNIVTIGIGTLFRFWAYKRFVFLHPDRVVADDAELSRELAD